MLTHMKGENDRFKKHLECEALIIAGKKHVVLRQNKLAKDVQIIDTVYTQTQTC